MAHQSRVLADMPVEIINVEPVNHLVSKCDVKVLYKGKNRNRSYITKTVGNKMASSLPTIPIVGEFLEEAKDFGDHAEEMVIDSKGIRFRKRTIPYGMVPENPKIWWQWFRDDDGVDREYMLCNGYLWTGRYPEARIALSGKSGQSMELDGASIKGEWAKLDNEDGEYFIVDEAVFSALCILGEDVEPCFESASIAAPGVLYSLNKDEFKAEFTQFMLDLKSALNSQEGGNEMDNDKTPVVTDPVVDPVVDPNNSYTDPGQDPVTDPVDPATNTEPVDPEFAKKKEDDEEEKKDGEPASEEPKDGDEPESGDDEEDKKKKKPSYTLEEVVEYQELKSTHEQLVADFNAMKTEFDRLKAEEAVRVKADKEALIAKFSVYLGEEDVEEVNAGIDNFTLEEIESKLSVIAVRKKVNFNLGDADKTEDPMNDPIVSYNANTVSDPSVPAWLKAVEARKNRK